MLCRQSKNIFKLLYIIFLPILFHSTLNAQTLDGQSRIEIVQDMQDGEPNQISIETTYPSFEYPLTLTLNSDIEVNQINVELELGPFTRTDSVVNGQMADISFSIQDVTIFRDEYETIILTGTIPEETVYSGWFTLSYEDVTNFYFLEISRIPTPNLLVNRTSTNVLEYTFDRSNYNESVTLSLATGQLPVTDLVARIDNLRSPNFDLEQDTSIDCSICDTLEYTIEANSPFSFNISHQNLEPFPYTADLILAYQGIQQIVEISLIPTPMRQNIVFVENAPRVVSSRTLPFRDTFVDIQITIVENEGRITYIEVPDLHNVIRTINNDINSISTINYEVFRLVNGQLLPIYDNQNTGSNITNPIEINPRESATFVIRISSLGIGTYQGTVEIEGYNLAPLSKEISFAVKHNVWIPSIVVLVGVVISYIVSWWVKNGRANSIRNIEIERTRNGFPNESQDEVWEYLKNQLQNLHDTKSAENFDEKLNDLRKRISQYSKILQIHQELLTAVEDIPEWQHESENCSIHELRDLISTHHVSLQNAIRQDNASHTAIQTSISEYSNLTENIQACILKNGFADLLKRIQTLLDLTNNSQVLHTSFELLEKKIVTKDFPDAVANNVYRDQVSELYKFYERYLSLYEKLLGTRVNKLQRVIHSEDTITFDRIRIVEAYINKPNDDISDRIRDIQSAHKYYLGALISYIVYLWQRELINTNEIIVETELTDFEESLRIASAFWEEGENAEVERILTENILPLFELANQSDPTVELLGSTDSVATNGKTFETEIIPTIQFNHFDKVISFASLLSGVTLSSKPSDTPEISRKIRTVRQRELIIFVLVVLVGTFAGIRILWEPRTDFGSLIDYIAALFWGLGVGEIGNFLEVVRLYRVSND